MSRDLAWLLPQNDYRLKMVIGCKIQLSVKTRFALTPGSMITELQNRATYYDVTNRVTNSKILLLKKIFELVTWCEKTLNVILEFFKENKISKVLTLNNKQK